LHDLLIPKQETLCLAQAFIRRQLCPDIVTRADRSALLGRVPLKTLVRKFSDAATPHADDLVALLRLVLARLLLQTRTRRSLSRAQQTSARLTRGCLALSNGAVANTSKELVPSFINVRSPALSVVALIGLPGILVGEHVIPRGRS